MTKPTEFVLAWCPQCMETGRPHLIKVCVVCGWPPALDGNCICGLEEPWPVLEEEPAP